MVRYDWASLVVQMVKNPSAVQETQVQSLGQEDLLEQVMATHCNILAWRISWTKEPGALNQWGCKVGHDWGTNIIIIIIIIIIIMARLGFPAGPVVKNPPANEGDMGSILHGKILYAAGQPSFRVTTIEPVLSSLGAPNTESILSPRAATTEACVP